MKLQYREATARQLEWNVRTGHVSHRFHPQHSFPHSPRSLLRIMNCTSLRLKFHGEKNMAEGCKGKGIILDDHRVRKSKLNAFRFSHGRITSAAIECARSQKIPVALVSRTGFACWMRAFPRRTQFQKLWCRTSWGKLQR